VASFWVATGAARFRIEVDPMKHVTIGRVALALLATGVACLSLAAVASAGGGISASAQLCQNSWQTLLRSDGSSFANQGACVSYAAQGGALQSTSCAFAGGTFGVGGPDLVQGGAPGAGVMWVCNGIPGGSVSLNFLLIPVEMQCADDNGIGVRSSSDRPGGPVNFTCYDSGGG
jgi:hypothetical protein